MCRNSPGGSAPSEPMRSPATTSWTWRPPPMFGSALTSRLTPFWRRSCLTASRPRCQSPERRSQRRSGRHRCPPGLRRLRCRSPAPVPSMARLISRLDPAVLGRRVAAGDPALDDLAGESTGLTPPIPNAAAPARPLCGHRANIADLHVSVGDVVEALEGGRAFRPESRTHCHRQIIVSPTEIRTVSGPGSRFYADRPGCRIRTERQVTQPSSFSNSLIGTAIASRPRVGECRHVPVPLP